MRNNGHGVGAGFVQVECGNKVLGEVYVFALEAPFHQMRSILIEPQRVGFRRRLEIGQYVGGLPFKIDFQVMGDLRLISIGAQRNREI